MNQFAKDPETSGGTVTRLAAQRKNPERVSVFVDGEFAIGIHRDVLLDIPVSRGMTLTSETLVEMEAADERIRARRRALDLVAYRARSEQELRRRLARDGYSDEAAGQAIERLEQLGYVDDSSFAAEYAAARFRSKGYGRRRIVAELRQRGVKPDLAEHSVADALGSGEAELDRARDFAEKRVTRLKSEPDLAKRRKKLYDALARRGYEMDIIRRVIDEVIQ